MSHFNVLVFMMQFALSLYQFSTEPSWSAFLQLIPLIVIFAILSVIWLLRKRLLYQIPNLLTLALALQLGVFVLGTPMAIAVKPAEI